jgi:hypothetical protein
MVLIQAVIAAAITALCVCMGMGAAGSLAGPGVYLILALLLKRSLPGIITEGSAVPQVGL